MLVVIINTFFHQSCMHTKNKYHTYHSSSKLLYTFKQSMVSLVYHGHFRCGVLLCQRLCIDMYRIIFWSRKKVHVTIPTTVALLWTKRNAKQHVRNM